MRLGLLESVTQLNSHTLGLKGLVFYRYINNDLLPKQHRNRGEQSNTRNIEIKPNAHHLALLDMT
ncbi:Uncharacterised protein [Vibrio cholerae]|nr:Uncharacterised protein [Vibrio cholerae]